MFNIGRLALRNHMEFSPFDGRTIRNLLLSNCDSEVEQTRTAKVKKQVIY
jgi:hypothetical protein